jgi:uncharacterized membrane protein
MLYIVTYIATLVPFLLIDGVWLSIMSSRLYKPTLGDMALDAVRWTPALAFYLLYPVGMMILAVLPALKSGQVSQAALYGAVLGLSAYGTYDLTNHATLRNWSVTFTLVDMAWGAILSAVVASLAFLLISRFGPTT